MQIGSSKDDSETSSPRILVVGTGAIGAFYGGKLAQAGARVSVVCRSDYDVVKSNGLWVTSVLGDFQFVPEKVINRVDEYGTPPDYILVATKVVRESDTVELIQPVVEAGTVIVLIQNGIEIEGPVAEAFPDNEVVSGLAYIAVSRVGPGRIHHQAYGRLTLGRYPSGDSPGAGQLSGLLEASGVPCEVTPHVVTARWQKLVWNAPFNPISVLGGGVDTRAILGSPESARLVEMVMKEVRLVAQAGGHELPPSVIEDNIRNTRAMEPYKTSMLLDFEAGRPMEVEAILGNAVRIAGRQEVPVPCMQSLYALLQLVDRKNLSKPS